MTDDEPDARKELDAPQREIALLRLRVDRLERQLSSATPLIEQAKHLSFWDFTPYGVTPDSSWVAVDRTKAMSLMGALAEIDHWNPWGTGIEPRPQP
jgi:hypothetical protein